MMWGLTWATPFGAYCLVFSREHCFPYSCSFHEEGGSRSLAASLFLSRRGINDLTDELWRGIRSMCGSFLPLLIPLPRPGDFPHCKFLQERPSRNLAVTLLLGLSEHLNLICRFRTKKTMFTMVAHLR